MLPLATRSVVFRMFYPGVFNVSCVLYDIGACVERAAFCFCFLGEGVCLIGRM